MTTKKIPISLNDEDQANIQELIKLMGIEGVYGDIPKALKFGITLALSTIKNPQKVYSYLNDDELEVFLSSIKRFEIQQRAKEKAAELIKDSQKV